MSFEDPVSSEVLKNSNNVLPKAENENEKEIQRFLSTNNNVFQKIEYPTIY